MLLFPRCHVACRLQRRTEAWVGAITAGWNLCTTHVARAERFTCNYGSAGFAVKFRGGGYCLACEGIGKITGEVIPKMNRAFAQRIVWSGLLVIAAPLACGSPEQSGGSPRVDESGGAGVVTAGAPNAVGGSGGKGVGGAGNSAAGAPAPVGGSGNAQAGAPAAGGSGSAGKSGGGAGETSNPPGSGATCDFVNEKQFCACLNASCGGDTIADKASMLESVYCGVCAATQTCVGVASPAGGAIGACQTLTGLTDAQKAKAAALTSIWENSTPTLDYGYSENIHDERGFTSGRAGFCSGTGDGIVVVQCITAVNPNNALAKYLPALVAIEKKFVSVNGDLKAASGGNKDGNIVGLDGYDTAWKSLGNDAAFRKCQDSVVDAVYYGPALQKANAKKFTHALTIVSLWDAQILHGEADPKFGLVVMMGMADQQVKLSDPPTLKEESDWLGAFHKIRAQIMTTRHEWKSNIYRVATYEQLRIAGNMDFTGCVKTGDVSASTYWSGLPGDKADSYSVCDK